MKLVAHIKQLKKTIKFIYCHPVSKRKKFFSLVRFLKWQLVEKHYNKGLIKPWIENSKTIVKKNLNTATANYYVGLQEFEEMMFLLHFLSEDDLFADIGANIGGYTILASKIKKATSYAFEPAPETLEILRKNIALNKIENKVEIFDCALGSTSGSVNFTSLKDSENQIVVQKSDSTVKVKICCLDELLETPPQLIKIDTEGFEYNVLKGAERIISDSRQKVILIEINGHVEYYGNTDADVHNYLLAHGYKIYSYSPEKRELYQVDSYKDGNNIYIKDLDYVRNKIKKSRKINIYGYAV